MINTYRHISDQVFMFGLRPTIFFVLVITAGLIFSIGLWIPAIIYLIIGYRYGRKYRYSRYQAMDIFWYYYLPELFSVEREDK